jgi:uncharacterized protein YdaU (DUF1376 family)
MTEKPELSRASMPWGAFYFGDFFASTIVMKPEVKGIFMTLLCLQWEHEHLPDDETCKATALAYAPAYATAYATALEKFPVCEDGKRRNSRLDKERRKRCKIRNASVDAAQKRWEDRNGDATAYPTAYADACDRHDASPSTSTSPSGTSSAAPESERDAHPREAGFGGMESAATARLDALKVALKQIKPAWGHEFDDIERQYLVRAGGLDAWEAFGDWTTAAEMLGNGARTRDRREKMHIGFPNRCTFLTNPQDWQAHVERWQQAYGQRKAQVAKAHDNGKKSSHDPYEVDPIEHEKVKQLARKSLAEMRKALGESK